VKVLSADAGISDGLNPSLALLDEQHASKTDDMYQVLKSGMGMRKNPLVITISSGGYLMDGFPFYERVQHAHRVLTGENEDSDDMLYILFEMDPDDDWTDSNCWVKANPSLGEIVQTSFLFKRLKDAKTNMATQTDFKIKNLDIFVTAKNIWLNPANLDKVCTKLDMEKLKGECCYAGCDLSSVGDLASIALCWPPNEYREYYPDKYLFKIFTWVPQAALESSNGALYEQFIHMGILKMTSGNSIDYDEILRDLVELNNDYPIVRFMYDEWNATSFIQNLSAMNIIQVVEPMSQSLGSFNRGTKHIEISVNNEQCLIDSNPLVRFFFNNCELKYDSFGNCKPVKANGMINKKIDGIIAMIQAVSGYLFEQLFSGNMEVINLDMRN